MKWLILGMDTLDCAAANCGIALRKMGHEVHYFDPAAHPSILAFMSRTWQGRLLSGRLLSVFPGGSQLFERAFMDAVEQLQPDVVLIIAITTVSARAVESLKHRSRAKVVGWFQDAVVNLGRHDFMLAPYDGLFFKDPYIVERLRDYAGMDNVSFLPEACEPAVHHKVTMSAEEKARFACDLMFYGNFYPYRVRLLEQIDHSNLRFYGLRPARWARHPLAERWQGRNVFYDEKARAVLGAKIVLSTSHFGEVRSVNARVFEVAGIGGFQLADAPGVGDFFDIEKEVVTFKGPRQLRQLIAHYLPREDERREIAARAQARAHKEHTYEARLRCLIDTLEVGGSTRKPA